MKEKSCNLLPAVAFYIHRKAIEEARSADATDHFKRKSPMAKRNEPVAEITTEAAANVGRDNALGAFKHTFSHKDMGDIGTLDVDLDSLPTATLRFALTFGLRTILQNTYAGINEAEVAKGLWGKKLDALLAGSVNATRSVAGDPVAKEMKRLAELDVKARLRAKGIALNKVSKEKMNAAIEAVLKAKDEELRTAAQMNLDNAAKLAVGEDTTDLDALLGLDAE